MIGNSLFTRVKTSSILLKPGFDVSSIDGRQGSSFYFTTKEINRYCHYNPDNKKVSKISYPVPLSGFYLNNIEQFVYSAHCQTPGNRGWFHLANFKGLYQIMPKLFVRNPRVFLSKRWVEDPREKDRFGDNRIYVRSFTTLLGRFDTCRVESDKNPNTIVHNVFSTNRTEFEVFKDIYFEPSYMKELRRKGDKFNKFKFDENSLAMKIFNGLVINGKKARILGHSKDGKTMAIITDNNATLNYKGHVIDGVNVEMIFSGDGQFTLFMKSKKMWYYLVKEAMPLHWKIEADCLGLEHMFIEPEVG